MRMVFLPNSLRSSFAHHDSSVTVASKSYESLRRPERGVASNIMAIFRHIRRHWGEKPAVVSMYQDSVLTIGSFARSSGSSGAQFSYLSITKGTAIAFLDRRQAECDVRIIQSENSQVYRPAKARFGNQAALNFDSA